MDTSYEYKHRFSLDFETRSDVDLPSAGMYKSLAAKGFKILMMSYAMDDEPVKLYECPDRRLPRWFIKDILFDPTILKTAYNAPYEINSIEAEEGIRVDISQWQCTRVMAGMAGYPNNLGDTAKAMGLATLKNTRGKALIKLFSNPASERDYKRNGGNFWNLPEYYPEAWEEFCEYCVQDTVVERAILTHPTVADMPTMPFAERRYWLMDQRINRRGVKIDTELVENIREMYEEHITNLVDEGTRLTGLDNINSPKQLLTWLDSNDCFLMNLRKDTVMEKLGMPGLAKKVKRVLEIRQETSKSSMGKYDVMHDMVHLLDRIYGLYQHYGANRTGRVTSLGLNVANIVKNKMKHNRLKLVRQLVRNRMPKTIQAIFGKLSKIFSEITRTMFIPRDGCKFIVSDFASIESVGSAWIADAEWKLQAFREGKDIYLVNAEAMYGVPYEELAQYAKEHDSKHPLREPAKVGELLCGYRGGENAMISGGALNSGQLTERDLQGIKRKWRKINPEIVKCWSDLEKAAKEAIRDPGLICPIPNGKVKYMMQHGNLLCKLPSGRSLSYANARIERIEKVNKQYNPIGILGWVRKNYPTLLEERSDGNFPLWVVEGFKYPAPDKDDFDMHIKDFTSWMEHMTGEEFPWFIVDRYCTRVRIYESILYDGMQDMGNGQRRWGTADTHGGKFLENIVQGICRDILYNAMENLEAWDGVNIVFDENGDDVWRDEFVDTVMHTYDETINECPLWMPVETVNRIMQMPVPWAPDMPLKAESFETDFYMKE